MQTKREAVKAYLKAWGELLLAVAVIAVFSVLVGWAFGWRVDLGVALAACAFMRVAHNEIKGGKS